MTAKVYILGRRGKEEDGLLNIGRYYALDASLGSNVYVDALKPHVILICGKRGYGKSYTLGVFIEEIMKLDDKIRKNIAIIVVDTLGIFWTLSFPNSKQMNELSKWGMEPEGFSISILTSNKMVEEYNKRGMNAGKLTIKTSEIHPLEWMNLFGLSMESETGAIITRAVTEMDGDYSLDDIIDSIKNDDRMEEYKKIVAENFFLMAKSWNIFDKKGMEIKDIVVPGKVTILDVSSYPEELKSLIVAIIARKIFEERINERKKEEDAKMKGMKYSPSIPITWLAIDEAHIFLPHEENICKDVLIKQWMRQGRQPGVALIMATQRPSSIDEEVISHSDIIISHRLTAQEDIDALNRVRPTYMHGEMKEAIKKVGKERGVALIVDDVSESVHIIKIRPRMSWHAGEEPSAKND